MFIADDFQIEAINDIKSNNNVLVVAPTGSGKTYIAEKSIEHYLSKQKNVFYTTPIKALSNQKFNDFNRDGISTGLLTGDRTINKDSELVVATTEILRNMIFSNDEKLENTGLIILDEVHYLGDKDRGTTWEEIIIHANQNIKFLCLSATIKNKNEFLEWIVSLRGSTSLVNSEIRPIPLEISLVTSSKSDKNIKIIKSSKDNKNRKIFKFDRQAKQFTKPKLNEQAAYLESRNLLPVIFFFFSRERVESSSRQLANKMSVIENKNDIKDKYNEVFKDLTPEEINLLNLDEHMWMWSRGVGFHHAGLAPIVKEFVEYLFLNRYIKYLFATETLALGINMPAKSIYIDRLHKYDGIKTRPLTQSEFLQLSGRAGRRGIDDKGFAFLSYDKSVNREWYSNLFTLKPNDLISAFSVNYSSILNLLNIYNEDEAVELLRKSFFAYQNMYKTDKLEKLFSAKYGVLNQLGFLNSDKGLVLTQTYRDNLIPAIYLFNKEKNKDIEFKLMYISSGITNERAEFALNDKFDSLLSSFNSSLELVNKTEVANGVGKPMKLNFSWFSVFYEYMKTSNIEYVINKFGLNIGDFIKVAKEASELSKKLAVIYSDTEFEEINDIFNNKLIQKTMT
ncbi:MAG: DEAD/DEAH box helicase [Candidatus Actinomarina sp.]|tara:strand:+ start:3912 stop:5777 length:1866 start_codon:yes stop_codon:yes gene_type:complete